VIKFIKNKKTYDKTDVVKDVIMFFVTTAVTYGYVLFMLLLISFIFMSYVDLLFTDMLVISGVCAFVVAVAYIIVKTVGYSHRTYVK